jgi:hypothetical protein
MEANNMISIIISSRELGRKNPGDLKTFLSHLKMSLYDPNNVEIVFKFDNDDTLIEQSLNEAASLNPELNIKYFFSDRYGYLGLHKAYYECLKVIDSKSYVIVILADDFLCKPNSHWDKQLLEASIHLKNEPFVVQDKSKLGQMHDIPIFSKKMIDLVSLGNSLSVDSWSIDICSIYLEYNLNDYIIYLPEFTHRQTCAYDWGHERWNIEREQLIQYLNSQEYKELKNECKNKIKNYFKL